MNQEHWQTIRPKFMRDALFVPSETGVLFKNNLGSFTLNGKSAYTLAERLLPVLDGSKNLGELFEGADGPRLKMFLGFIQTLLDRKILRDIALEDPHDLEEAVQQAYQAQIEYIHHFLDQPKHYFQQFRETTFAICATSGLAGPLIESLVNNGAYQFHIFGGQPDLSHTQAKVAEQGLSLALTYAKDLEAAVSAADMVLIAVGDGDFQSYQAFGTAAMKANKPLLAGIDFEGELLVGPLVELDEDLSFDTGIQRMLNAADAGWVQKYWRRRTPLGRSMPVSRDTEPVPFVVMANTLAFEAFKFRTTCFSPETTHSILIQDSHHLTNQRHPVLPFQRRNAPSGRSSLDAFRAANDSVELDSKQVTELLNKGVRLRDNRSGILSSFDDQDFFQLPLKRSHLTLRFCDGWEPSKHYAFSLQTPLYARYETLKSALREFAAWQPHDADFQQKNDGTWTVPVWSMRDQDWREQPVSIVFPHLSMTLDQKRRARSVGRSESLVGFGVGHDFDETFLEALTASLGQQALKMALGQQIPLKPIDLSSIENPTLVYLLKTLAHLETPIKAYLLQADCHVQTCLVVPDHVELGKWVGVGLSSQDALVEAITRLVSLLQARKYEEPLGADPNELSDLNYASFVVGDEKCDVSEQKAEGQAVVKAALERYADVGIAYATPVELARTKSLECLRVLIIESP